MLVAWDGELRGVVVVADTVKPASATAVAGLRAIGLHPMMVTGDNRRRPNRSPLQSASTAPMWSPRLPEDKVATVERLQASGRVVCDGRRRGERRAALAPADLGIAMGTGTDVAIEASDLTLVGGDLRATVDAINLSRRTLRTIKGNLFWAFAYNVLAIPSPPPGCSTRCSPARRWPARACSSFPPPRRRFRSSIEP